MEGDLKGEGSGVEVEVEVEVLSFRSADRSSSFSQPTALVLRFSYGQCCSVSWMNARRVSSDG